MSLVFNFGTIFVSSAILTGSDVSAFETLTAVGRGNRVMFDRRSESFETFNAYIFKAKYADGLTIDVLVNPEFGSVAAARKEALFYAEKVGQLPKALRLDVDELWIHEGVELFGGGNRSILIHTGQGEAYIRDGILEETLVHEATHTSLDPLYAQLPAWLAAQASDPAFISDYARDFPQREDMAETFLMYLAVTKYRSRLDADTIAKIEAGIPARIAFFDSLDLDLSIRDASGPPDFDQTITGGPADDRLVGDGGNDEILGLSGNDTLIGRNGRDKLLGASGADNVKGGGGDDTIKGGGGSDTLKGGGGGDKVLGGAGRDTLKGGGGGDKLVGNGGKDLLEGGGGNDTLKGGGGKDQFVFSRNKGDDRVQDFKNGKDKFIIKNGANDFSDINVFSEDGKTFFAFAGTTVRVDNVGAGRIDASDFIFGKPTALKPLDDDDGTWGAGADFLL